MQKNVRTRPRRHDRAKFETIRPQADSPEKKAALLQEFGGFLKLLGFVDPHTWSCHALEIEIDHILPYRVRGREYFNPDNIHRVRGREYINHDNVYFIGGAPPRAKTTGGGDDPAA